MNSLVEMHVSTLEGYMEALRISQNSFLKNTSIKINNINNSFAKPTELIKQINYGLSSVFSSSKGNFASSQMYGYSANTIANPFGLNCKIFLNAEYYSNKEEMNNLICSSAGIAETLNKKIKHSNDDIKKIVVLNEWIKKHFSYKNTNKTEDHAAVSLLVNRHGVCQAIAALSTLILSYMGIKTMYVVGQGRSQDGWGGHAWNIVFVNDRWIHIDFTHSMNLLFLSSTLTKASSVQFRKKHLWDEQEYASKRMDYKWNANNRLNCSPVLLKANKKYCFFNGVIVKFSKPLLIIKNSEILVDMKAVIRMLGGGVEMSPNNKNMIICLNNMRRRVYVGDKRRGDYYDIDILKKISRRIVSDGNIIGALI